MTSSNKRKVVIAMSGGVDSSVAAALLKREGFSVAGVFMRLADLPNFKKAENRARKVAKVLNIPFYVFDFRREFKKKVIDYFLEEYKEGRTPNPCVVCNKEIKFGLLFAKAKKLKIDFIATGHYARITKFKVQSSKRKTKTQNSKLTYKLLKGKDEFKDQSYFLWRLSQNQLKHIIFPVGDYTKKEVKRLAQKFNLPTAQTPESQEICFVKTRINDFLRKYLKTRKGKIVDKGGNVLGEHQGLTFYTIGQRKSIRLSAGPYYVVDKNLKKNILIVTKNEKDLLKKELIVKSINWISSKEPKLPLELRMKIRYRHKPASATIVSKMRGSRYKIRFKKPERAITPGQSAVFYRREEMIGGGIIT